MSRVLTGARLGNGEPGLLLSRRLLKRVLRGFREWRPRGLSPDAMGACASSITALMEEKRRGTSSARLQSSFPPPLRTRIRKSRNSQLENFCTAANLHEEDAAVADSGADDLLPVYLYIPNIVGYMRILMNCVAFAFCFRNRELFIVLHFLSFVCDGLDGWFARKLNQVSMLGAALDMVTDRVSTACLLVILSQIYSPGLIFLSLLSLDIASHWLQMYSSLLLGKVSHKDVDDSSHWVLKAYYRHQLFMGFCCVASEVMYITLFILAGKKPENVVNVVGKFIKRGSPFLVTFMLVISGWGMKQVVNALQMKTAADACISYDMKKNL